MIHRVFLVFAVLVSTAVAQQVPEGMVLNEWANEDQVANPVAIDVDEKGRVYVAETFRQNKGVFDNRSRGFWLLDDLAAQTVEDRVAYIKKWVGKVPLTQYTTEEDRVTRLSDSDGDGQADQRIIFSGEYNEIPDGTGAGVLAVDGTVYYTCIPHLWKLPDTDNDGVADKKESLSYGYGVRTALRGHDSHGLVRGPDGRIYFSIGDRGYHVKTREGKLLHDPGSGAVFRCDLNGDNLELFATGLRNPQELAFDAHGNLWTGDNNSDAGDKARIVYVAEGGETGWHMSYQTMGGRYSRGPWHMDKLWHTQHEGQAAWVLPPIAHVSNGPSGFAYYPGTGLDSSYDGTFFLVDFKGSSGNSGVYSWKTESKGAGFELVEVKQFAWNMLITDLCFGYDGKIYMSDWINGWDGLGKGKIFTLHDPKACATPEVLETKKLFAEGFKQRETAELAKLLKHVDMRVRFRAQYALAEKGPRGVAIFEDVIEQKAHALARLHGIWGIWQVGRTQPAAAKILGSVLSDSDGEVVAQAARIIGEVGHHELAPKLVELLERHPSGRVKYFAAMSLGKLRYAAAAETLLQVLRSNEDKDVFLRHACVMGLTGALSGDALVELSGDTHRSARLGVLLALRRHKDPRIALFLKDSDPALVEEAARAINDLPLSGAMPLLAEALFNNAKSRSFVRRAINANFRVGDEACAQRLTDLAGDSSYSDELRTEALSALGDWERPNPRDRVLGYYRPLDPRDIKVVRAAVGAKLPRLMQAKGDVQNEATRLAKRLGIKADSKFMRTLVGDTSYPLANRQEALAYLVETKDAEADKALRAALNDPVSGMRAFALKQMVGFNPRQAMSHVEAVLRRGGISEQQAAYQVLSSVPGEAEKTKAARLVAHAVANLEDVPKEARLDAVEAARKLYADPEVKAALDAYETGMDRSDMMAPFRVVLYGGDAERGRELFESHIAAQCMRCHKAGDGHSPGGEAGPNLWGIGGGKTREYILESLVNPSAVIAEGFDIVTIQKKDGTVAAGTLHSESDVDVVLVDFVGKKHYVLRKDIKSREAAKASAMPPMGAMMKPAELRDMVEFLVSLKDG